MITSFLRFSPYKLAITKINSFYHKLSQLKFMKNVGNPSYFNIVRTS